jgi:hypothetical protein
MRRAAGQSLDRYRVRLFGQERRRMDSALKKQRGTGYVGVKNCGDGRRTKPRISMPSTVRFKDLASRITGVYVSRSILCLLLIHSTAPAYGQVPIEDVALEIARLSNRNAQAVLDDMTLAFSARASGRNVIFDTVVRMKRDLSPEQRADYKEKVWQEVTPRTCQQNADNEAFKRGLFYTFVYRNVAGEEIGRFSVDAILCSRILPFSVRRDVTTGFQIGYPSMWAVATNASPNTKFAVVSPMGNGACNVVARSAPESTHRTQAELDQEISKMADDNASWAVYMGPNVKLVRVLESRRIRIANVQALAGVTETVIQLQSGPLAQKGMSAMALTPGWLWVLTCTSGHRDARQSAADFDAFRPTYEMVFRSFTLLR